MDPTKHLLNMITGRDLMHALGINILFDTAEISWDSARFKMQPPERINGDWIVFYYTSYDIRGTMYYSSPI